MDTLRPPPWLGGMTLLFWGWQSGLLPFAVLMAAAFEGVRFVRWRWALSDRDLTRITDLNMLLLVGVAAYLFLEHGSQGLFVLTRWLPVVTFLLVGVLLYSQTRTIALSSLFLSLRRSRLAVARQRVDLAYLYLLLCLVAAAMQPTTGFFEGLIVLTVWALWSFRPRRYAIGVWVAALALAIGGSLALQDGIRQAQAAVESLVMDWVADWYHLRDPSEQHTMIGQIGEIKLSERILMRVHASERLIGSGLLLRQTSYDRYFEGRWRDDQGAFNNIFPLEDTFDWVLAEGAAKEPFVEVSMHLRRGRGILPLPAGTYRIDGLVAAEAERSAKGVIRVVEGAEYVAYKARLGERTPRDAPPGENDLHLPQQEAELLRELVAGQGLDAGEAADRVEQVRRFFGQGFGYSLVLNPSRWPSRTALGWFLTESRTGHCEYYATATVLLLRAAGVPTRYASGYLVTEYSPWEEAYLVRRSHAHAWAMAYLDGQWVDVDTTPAIWVQQEADAQPFWQPVSDLLSWALDAWRRWQWREGEEEISNDWLAWLLVPLILALGWRLYRRDRVRREPGNASRSEDAGPHSPFYRVMDRLISAGYEKREGEPLGAWLRRVRPPDPDTLGEMLVLHERLRFDPLGLDAAAMEDLEHRVERWLEAVDTLRNLPTFPG